MLAFFWRNFQPLRELLLSDEETMNSKKKILRNGRVWSLLGNMNGGEKDDLQNFQKETENSLRFSLLGAQ